MISLNKQGFCLISEYEIIRRIEEFDAITLILMQASFLATIAMTFKASLGVIILAMLSSLYLKVKSI